MASSGVRWIHFGLAVAACGVLLPSSADGQDRSGGIDPDPVVAPADSARSTPAKPRYVFYRPERDYGSAAWFGPTNVVLNRGFSTLVWQTAEHRPLHIDWKTGWHGVWWSLAHPDSAIAERGGVKSWLHGEIGPISWDPWAWMFASNWAGHTVAGGITYRMLSEWYDHRDVPAPRVFAGATIMGSILVNEAIEAQHDGGPSASTTADVYIFEPLGIGLFSIDAVADVFARYLHADDWSPQASVTFPDLQLENISQVVSYHFGVPFVERVDVLALLGQGSQFGFLYDADGEYSVGGTAGFVALNRLVDQTSAERVIARLSGGLYLVRNNSLLVSLNAYRGSDTHAELNLYPGVIGDLGGWAIWRRGGKFSIGLSTRELPGLGLGYNSARVPPPLP